MKLIIDRFENQFAICEDEQGNMVKILLNQIPRAAKEGDVLIKGFGCYKIDYTETDKRKKNIKGLMEELWKD